MYFLRFGFRGLKRRIFHVVIDGIRHPFFRLRPRQTAEKFLHFLLVDTARIVLDQVLHSRLALPSMIFEIQLIMRARRVLVLTPPNVAFPNVPHFDVVRVAIPRARIFRRHQRKHTAIINRRFQPVVIIQFRIHALCQISHRDKAREPFPLEVLHQLVRLFLVLARIRHEHVSWQRLVENTAPLVLRRPLDLLMARLALLAPVLERPSDHVRHTEHTLLHEPPVR